MIFFWKSKLLKSIRSNNTNEFLLIMSQYGEKTFDLICKGSFKNILYESIRYKSEEIYNFLIKSPNLNKIINVHEYPIFRAIIDNEINKTIELLNLGANPNLTRNTSYVGSYYCSSQEMFEVILRDNRFIISFKSVIEYGTLENSKIAIERSDSRENPLYFAIEWDKLEFTQEFIQYSKFINETDQIFNIKPVFVACNQKNIEHLNCLIKAGVDLNVFNEEGDKPLHVTCENGFIEHTKLLLENGCSLHDLNKGDSTPYNVACWSDHKEIQDFLDEYIKIHMPNNLPTRDY